MKIPKNEQENVLGVLWALLKDAEGRASKDLYLKGVLVPQTYDLLNRIGFTKARPRWESKDNHNLKADMDAQDTKWGKRKI
jgi:hypothetical protein